MNKYKDKKELKIEIGLKLKKARLDAGLSQSALAQMLSLTHGAIGSYERGRLEISTGLLIKLCEILNRPITYFLGEEQDLVDSYKKEQENKENKYDLKDNLKFSMEMAIRNYLRSEGIKNNLVEKIDEILKFIKDITNK